MRLKRVRMSNESEVSVIFTLRRSLTSFMMNKSIDFLFTKSKINENEIPLPTGWLNPMLFTLMNTTMFVVSVCLSNSNRK